MKLTYIILSFLLITACTSPYDEKVPTDINSEEAKAQVKKIADALPEDDRKLLGAYMARTMMASAFKKDFEPASVTVSQAIEMQKQWVEKKKVENEVKQAKADAIEKERAKALAKMDAVITTKIIDFGFQEGEYGSHKFHATIQFVNKSKKEISGIKGTVLIHDMFDKKLIGVDIASDYSIGVDELLDYRFTWGYNQFIQRDNVLKNSNREKLIFKWQPNTYIFKDGSKLEIAE